MNKLFAQELAPGKSIRPFMVAGVLEKDYPGERTNAATVQYVEETMDQAIGELRGPTFREFDAFTLCGMEGRWTLCTDPSPRYADGHYYICLLYTSATAAASTIPSSIPATPCKSSTTRSTA